MLPQGREQRAASRGQIPRPRRWRRTYLASLPLSKATVSWSGWVDAAKYSCVDVGTKNAEVNQ